jgi:hypothetical protein
MCQENWRYYDWSSEYDCNKITSLGTPTVTGDAANKQYVDNQIGNYVSKTGDT